MFNYAQFDIVEYAKNADIRRCLCIEKKIYDKKPQIIHLSDANNNLGIIESGLAYLVRIDVEGRRNILEYYEQGDVFGKMFAPYSDVNSYYIEAQEKCTVSFFDGNKLTEKCANNCDRHTHFLNSIMLSSFFKAQTHIDILSQRSTKAKLISFFEYMKTNKNSNRIILPVSLSDLADYLSVDRSAMMREIKKLKDSGAISVHGQTVTLIKNEYIF